MICCKQADAKVAVAYGVKFGATETIHNYQNVGHVPYTMVLLSSEMQLP